MSLRPILQDVASMPFLLGVPASHLFGYRFATVHALSRGAEALAGGESDEDRGRFWTRAQPI